MLVYGAINDSDDNDYYLVTLTGPSAIDVAGRRITQWTESAADTRLDLYDTDGVALDNCSIWFEIPTTADPRLFVETAGTYAVRVQAEDEGYGFYALNVRPLVVINEVDNRSSSTNPFVELLGPPSFSLAGWALCTFDGNGDPVDAGDPCVDLSALSTDSMGYLAIQDSAVASSALALPPGPGALSLQYLGTPVDGVQYGAVTTGVLAEGEPAEVGTWRVIGRAAGVDTNNNRMDFMYMEAPSQGLPNDRKFPAALPLYGEPEG